MVQFEDHRLTAKRSILAVPDIIPYECKFFGCRVSKHCFRLTLVVIPSLRLYREKITPASGSIKITQKEFHFNGSTMSLAASEDSRERCWKIKMSNSTFEKEEVELLTVSYSGYKSGYIGLGRDPRTSVRARVWLRQTRSEYRYYTLRKV